MKFICIKKFYLLFLSIIISCSSEKDIYESPIDTNNIKEDIVIDQNITQQFVTTQEDILTSNSTESFIFNPVGSLSDKPITIFYHIPEGDIKNLPIVFSFHGASRNASSYRNYWIEMANENNFMVFAPEFDDINYEGGDKYNLANIFEDGDNPSIDTFNSSDTWTISTIDQIFDYIVSEIQGNQTNYNAWGHSAGAQFLHRFVLYLPNSKLNIAVSSNAGWYTVPDSNFDFPYGLFNSQIKDSTLTDAFSKKLYIHLGENDNNPNSSGLRHNEVVDLQGLNRFDRGDFFYQKSLIKAESINAIFNWIKIEVPEVSHNGSLMALDALQYIIQE
tara:strand:+ start:2029 stop:3024 length:996 start_codon:yes stop_codon:yes gene_type:complete